MIPDHFSRDVVRRCQLLLEELYPIVAGRHYGLQAGQRDYTEGPLTTTFLLSMAMPMLFLPIERIHKPNSLNQTVSDRLKSAELADFIDQALGDEKTFGAAPFNAEVRWCFARDVPAPDPTAGLGSRQSDALNRADAQQEAAMVLTRCALRDLRNALAHGAIYYLDADGDPTEGSVVTQLAFINRHPNSATCRIWRITEQDFHRFLRQWAEWLRLHGLDKEIARAA